MKTAIRFFYGSLALPFLLLSALRVTAVVPSSETKLTPADSVFFHQFGYAVAIDSATAVVGAPLDSAVGVNAGAAYVFVRDGEIWAEQAKLTASDAGFSAEFGNAVAISGDTIVVGAHLDRADTSPAGAAYVFIRNGTTWSQQAKLPPSDPTAGKQFGAAVAINGDSVGVGAIGDGILNNGAVYVFTRSGDSWAQQAKLFSNDPRPGNLLGFSVSLDGDTLVAGSPFDEDIGAIDSGALYVFVRSGTTWSQEAELRANDGAENDLLGWSIALSGDTMVAGAPQNSGSGAAYVFVRNAGSWGQQAKLAGDDAAAGDQFGYAVGLHGNIAVVGSVFDSSFVVNGSPVELGGSAYLFRRTGTTWTQDAEVSASDLESFDEFGFSVAVNGSTVIVGAPFKGPLDNGAAYVFASDANTAPVADSQFVTTDEDTAKSITLTASDAEADPLTFTVLSIPTRGTLSGTPPNLTYTPNPNETGTDSFTFNANDGLLDSAPATVSIVVTPVNDLPVAGNDMAATPEDNALNLSSATLLSNDSDVDAGTTLIISSVSGTSSEGGAVSLLDGSVTYTPPVNFNGSDSFTYIVSDADGGQATGTVTVTVTPVNDQPVADTQSVVTSQDSAIAIRLTGTDGDPEAAQVLTFAIVNGPSHGTLSGFDPATGQVVYAPAPGYFGSDSFAFTVTDDATAGGSPLPSAPAAVALMVNPANAAPVLAAPDATPSVINENDTITVSGSFTDANPTDAHAITIAWGDGTPDTVLDVPPGVFTYSAVHQYLDDQPSATASDVNTVTITADDGHGGTARATTTVTVNNLAPSITSVAGPTDPVALGSSASVSVNFSDVGTLDTHTAGISWGDGTADTVLSGGGFTRTATHTYAAAGVYTVGITVTDDDTGLASTTFQYIVIYEPLEGFVTGGGWIHSLPGAYVPDASLSGKASFGFVSKYQKGASLPIGQTEFQFHAAHFNFHSTIYEWLVVSGPLVQYRGSGTVNGAGDYDFLLRATDGQMTGGDGVDEFRIKIWDQVTGIVVYDNALGVADGAEPTNPLAVAGGSIVIHKAK